MTMSENGCSVSDWTNENTKNEYDCSSGEVLDFQNATLDKDAIHRLVHDEFSMDPLKTLPSSPVTVEIPFLGVRLATTKDGIIVEQAGIPPLHLPPTCMDGDMCDLSKIPVCNHDALTKCLDQHGFPNISLKSFSGMSVQDVAKLFECYVSHPLSRISVFWDICRENWRTREQILRLLDDRGIRLERKKRMGQRVNVEEKRAIRAQRNRERSQALRRHHKRRLALLEDAKKQLQVENGAMKALILSAVYFSTNDDYFREYLCEDGREELICFLGVDVAAIKAGSKLVLDCSGSQTSDSKDSLETL